MLSVSPGFLPESRAETDPSANNGPGTFNKFLDHVPLIGLRLISELNAVCSFLPMREHPYEVQLLRRQHALSDLLRAESPVH